jgi:hypothetical protein
MGEGVGLGLGVTPAQPDAMTVAIAATSRSFAAEPVRTAYRPNCTPALPT